MSPTPTGNPDVVGFAEAQRRLRAKLGQVVKFYTPEAERWDPALPSGAFDPETGEPYDPTIAPLGSGYTVASAVCSIAFAPLAAIRRDEVEGEPAGIMSRLNKDLIIDKDDYWVASGATMFELDGEFWTIVNTKASGVGALQRYVIFGQDRSGDLSDIMKEPTTGSNANGD